MHDSDSQCYNYLLDKCRIPRCTYSHTTNKALIGQWKKARRSSAVSQQALINTKHNSKHNVHFHCFICDNMLANAEHIRRIYNNAVWVNADTLPDNVIPQKEEFNIHKKMKYFEITCKHCNLSVGHYYPALKAYKLLYVKKYKKHYHQMMYMKSVDPNVDINSALSEHTPLMATDHTEGYPDKNHVKPIPKMFQPGKKKTEVRLAKVLGKPNPDELTEQLSNLVVRKLAETLTENEELKQKQAKSEEQLERLTCAICMDNDKNIALQCGHCLCNNCWTSLPTKVCPECRAPITNSNKIYI
jgi:hypothetical protein